MKTAYCFFFSLFLFIVGCTNEHKDLAINTDSDSLDFYFKKANDESIDFDNRYQAANRIKTLIGSNTNDSINRKNYFKLANRYFNMNAMDDYRITTEAIIQNSQKASDSVSLAKAYSYMGDYYGSKFNSEQAYQNYFNAEKIYIKLKDTPKIAKTLLNKSVIQFNEKDYVGSEKSAIKALEILKKTNHDELTYEANNILGVIYHELSEFDKAIQFHKAALQILKKQNVPFEYQSKATSLNNLGAVYQKNKEYKKALEFYNKSLRSENISNDKPALYATLIGNIAYSKFKLKEFESLPSLFYKSLELNDSIKYYPGIIGSKLNLSEFYAFQENIPLSQKFAKEAYSLANEKNLTNEKLLSLKQLSKIDPEHSSFYSENYIRINDSLQLSERKVRNKLARIEFETDELIEQKDRLVEQRKSLIYMGFGIIILGFFIYIIRSQMAKNRELVLIQDQQKANEEIYQLMLTQQEKIEEVRQREKIKIGQDLHDGILGKLFGTRMNLDALNTNQNNEAIEKRSLFISQLKLIENEIREISHDLNSEKTAILNNFVLMVSNFLENQQELYKTQVHFTQNEAIDWNNFDSITKINLYRILQEAFQNINKYANATTVNVNFSIENNMLQLKIEDNGVGFEVKKKKKGIGLQNMTNRIQALHGNLKIHSEIGKGTQLLFQIPNNFNKNKNEKNSPIING